MKENIEIIKACESTFSKDQYLSQLKEMIIESQKIDQTIVLHSDEEILERFNNSLIAIIDGKLIGNSSIYTTNMSPLNNIVLGGKNLQIGECGTVIISPEYRKNRFGELLTQKSLDDSLLKYDSIVSATVNNSMSKIMMTLGFKEIPFPKEYYNEGRIHLSPKMLGGENEFRERAKCLMHFGKVSSDTKKHILNILTNQ